MREIGPDQRTQHPRRVRKLCALERGPGGRDAIQLGAGEVGTVQLGIGQRRLEQIDVAEVGTGQIRVGEKRSLETFWLASFAFGHFA